MIAFWTTVLAGAFALCGPVIVAGLGEIYVERAGGFNVGIEGMMLVGAITGVLSALSGGVWVGLIGGLLAGAALGVVFGLATAVAHADMVIVGVAVGLFGAGFSTYVFGVENPAGSTHATAPVLPATDLPLLEHVPLVGRGLAQAGVFFYLALALAAATWWVLRYTRFGLRLRLVGDDEAVAVVRGVSPRRYRLFAAGLGGALAGLAGAGVPLTSVGAFTPNMTGGAGFVALAVVIIARRDPRGLVGGALLFAFFDSLALLAQTRDLGLPVELYQGFPYLVTLILLCAVAGRAKIRARQVRTPLSQTGTST